MRLTLAVMHREGRDRTSEDHLQLIGAFICFKLSNSHKIKQGYHCQNDNQLVNPGTKVLLEWSMC